MIVSEILIIFVLIVANGVFAGAEIAIVAMRDSRLQELESQGRRGARAVALLRQEPERFLATVQIGITVIGAAAAALGGARLADHLAPILPLPPELAPYADGLALTLIVAVVSYLSVVVGELVPKSLALRSAERYALLVAAPILWLSWFMRPLVQLLTMSSNVVLKPFGDSTSFSETNMSARELQQLVDDASKAGTLDLQVGQIASRALKFGELTLKDIMIPRARISGIPYGASPEKVKQILLESGYSRMPVYRETLDNIMGYVTAKDILGLAWEQPLIILDDLIRPPLFVPETARAGVLLQEFQQSQSALAIVVDEHGAVSGLVTLEDVVDELVGDIFNEDGEEGVLLDQEAHSAIVRGDAPIRDINRALEVQLPESERWSTVAGLCIALEGCIPRPGAKLTVRDGTTLEVIDASPRVVRRIRVSPRRASNGQIDVDRTASDKGSMA